MRQFLKEDNFKRALVFAAVFLAGTLPYLLYHYFVGYDEIISRLALDKPRVGLLIGDAVLIYIALLISGTAGFAWADGREVRGFGSFREAVRNLYWIVPAGIFIAAAVTLLSDNRLIQQDAVYYPREPLYALVYPLKSAFFDEGILRFGILTMMYRLTKSIWAAMTISSIAGILLGIPYASFLNLEVSIDAGFVLMQSIKFLMGIFFGYIYCRRGLKTTMILRFIIDLRYVYFALQLGR